VSSQGEYCPNVPFLRADYNLPILAHKVGISYPTCNIKCEMLLEINNNQKALWGDKESDAVPFSFLGNNKNYQFWLET
jgi:hypothetical protein